MDERAVGEVLSLTMGQSPPGDTCNVDGRGVPLLNGPTEFGPHHPSPVQWTTDPRRVCKKDAVLLCVRGSTTGRTNRADQSYAIGRGIAALEADDPIDQAFAYFALLASMASLLERTTGSVFPNVSRDDIARLRIPWPDQTTRRKIATLLCALDGKIEANARIRAASRGLGLALFEEALTKDSHTVRLGDLVSSVARGIAPKYVNPGEGVVVLNQKCIRDGWVSIAPARWMKSVDVPDVRVAYANDIVVNSTGVGTLGRVARWIEDSPIHVDGHVSVVRPNTELCHPAVLGYAMLASQPVIESLGEGSTGQTELSRERLSGFMITIPSGAYVSALGEALNVLDLSGHRQAAETDVLIRIRDALLPQLMSGQLRAQSVALFDEEAV